jgi:peptidoglycan/xylan/chitin deacetylase (PgdA/CDA1 family)
MFKKISSFLTDKRLPVYYLQNQGDWNQVDKYIKDFSESMMASTKPEVDVMLTIDIEHDYGSMGSGERRYIIPFLKEMKILLSRYNIKATLFVQGNLIKDYASELKALGDHEIGLHGYAHEPWGASWFVKAEVPSLKTREELLVESLKNFSDAGFNAPISFRAPNMVIDSDSLELLHKKGFKTDSSSPSFKGERLTYFFDHEMLEVPASYDPKPHFGRFKVARYAVFNISNMKTGEFSGGFIGAASRAINLQRAYAKRPMIVIVCHPWEFFKSYNEDKNLKYCGEENFTVLQDALESLRKIANPNYLTMQEFYGRLLQ